MGFPFGEKSKWGRAHFPPSAASSPGAAAVGREALVGGSATGSREGVQREKINLTSNDPVKELDLELQWFSPKPLSSPSGDSKLPWAWSTRSSSCWIPWSKTGPELDVNQQTTRHNVNISQGNHKAPENQTLFYQLWEKHHDPNVCGLPSSGEGCWLPFSKQCAWSQALHPSNTPHLSKNGIKRGFRDGDNFSITLPWNHKKLNHIAPGKRPAFNGIKCPQTLLRQILVPFFMVSLEYWLHSRLRAEVVQIKISLQGKINIQKWELAFVDYQTQN